MRSGQTAREIDEDAALWAVRSDPNHADPELERQIEDWLSGDPRRAGALLRAQAALSLVDRARALGAPPAPRPASISRRGLLFAGGGSALAAALAGGVFVATHRPEHFSTVRGELRRVPLADGSVAEINTDTAIEVALTSRMRRVRLQRGEAWFAVAKDARRPFVVQAADISIRAVGTAFSVYEAARGLEVLVTEGVVEASRAGDDRRLSVEAGSRLTVGPGGRFIVAEDGAAIARNLAWRAGQIDLDGRTLADAAAEFNRYNRRPIVIADPVLAGKGLIGLFATNESESFAKAVAGAFGAPLSESATEIRLGAAS